MDEIDRLLAAEDTVSPSSGFAAGVMAAIAESAATEPPARPFPWARFLAGVVACALSAAGVVWLVEAEGMPDMDGTLAALATAGPHIELAAATLFATCAALRVRRVLSR